MDYFKNQPGPTSNEELPLPKSKLESIKAKSEALSKRKLSDETNGKISNIF